MKKEIIIGDGKTHIYRALKNSAEHSPESKAKIEKAIEVLSDMQENGVHQLTPAEVQDSQDLIQDAVVRAANDAWTIQQRELTAAVRQRLEALGYRFDNDAEFNAFVMKNVTSHVIRDTTDNVVMLNKTARHKGGARQIPLLTYSTKISVENKDNSITIKIG